MGRLLKAKYAFWPPTNLFRLDLAMGLHYYHYRGAFPEERIAALRNLSDKDKRKVRLVQGHMGFGVHEYFPQPCRYITVIREPINRVFSQYHQMQHQSWFPYPAEIRAMPFEEFIEKHPIDALTNYQVKMLSGVNNGTPGNTSPYGCTPSDPDLLVKAQTNVVNRYLVVVTERFDESVLLLKRKLGWRNAHYIKSNVTKARRQKTDFDQSVIDLIRKHNELDIQLYDQVVQQLDSEIQSLGETFQREMRAFQKRNETLNRFLYWPIDRLLKFGRKAHVSSHRGEIPPAPETK